MLICGLAFAVPVTSADGGPRPILLAKGRLKGHIWALGVGPGGGSQARSCLLQSSNEASRYAVPWTQFEQVSKTCAVLTRRAPINLNTEVVGRPGARVTIFGLLAMPGISSVMFELGPRGARKVALSLLSVDDAETAGVKRLAYAGFAMSGEVCISGVEGLGAAGKVVYRDSEDDCGS